MHSYFLGKDVANLIIGKIIKEKKLLELIKYLLKNISCENLVNKITLSGSATYYEFDKKGFLSIDYKGLLEEAYQAVESFYLKDKYKNELQFINTYLLLSIIHEIEHIKQNSYYFLDNPSDLERYLMKEMDKTKENYEDYLEFHDCFMIERIAQFSIYISILSMYREFNLNEDIYKGLIFHMRHEISSGYTLDNGILISPIETIFDVFNLGDKQNVKCHNLSILDRSMYGLPLDIEEYKRIKTEINNRYF